MEVSCCITNTSLKYHHTLSTEEKTFVCFCLGTTSLNAACTALLEHKASTHLIKSNTVHKHIIGRHPCLWCTVHSDQLKQPLSERTKLPPRTLNSLQADYLRFQTAGKGDLRQAKHFNNAISPVFFNVPLNQVNKNKNIIK